MAFRPLKFSAMIAQDPAYASKWLSIAFAAHYTTSAVADEIGVGVNTVKRWLVLLKNAKYPVDRKVRAKRGWALGRPRGSKIARNFRGRKKGVASR